MHCLVLFRWGKAAALLSKLSEPLCASQRLTPSVPCKHGDSLTLTIQHCSPVHCKLQTSEYYQWVFPFFLFFLIWSSIICVSTQHGRFPSGQAERGHSADGRGDNLHWYCTPCCDIHYFCFDNHNIFSMCLFKYYS